MKEFYEAEWFGKPWSTPVNTFNPQTEVPIGRTCEHCKKEITENDSGMVTGSPEKNAAWHRDCFYDRLGKPRPQP